MRLSLEIREVGRVTIVRCNGRIVAGSESESLRSQVTWLLRDRRAIVLHLGEVGFIDRGGLGTIVRSLTCTRQVHGDLKLSTVPEHVLTVLELSQLTKLSTRTSRRRTRSPCFTTEEPRPRPLFPAAEAFFAEMAMPTFSPTYANSCTAPGTTSYQRPPGRRSDPDAGLAFRSGADRPELTSSAATHNGFQATCAKVPVIELGSDFSSCDAGEACAGLLQKIEARLNPKIA
jgi:anti-anti-sigma factor